MRARLAAEICEVTLCRARIVAVREGRESCVRGSTAT